MPQLNPSIAENLDVLPDEILVALANAATPDLGAGPADPSLAGAIEGCRGDAWGGISAVAQSLCESGLWLLAGDLHRSHEISQEHHTPEGSFWHGIMHRREGDFGNAKYWFRKVGTHPVSDQLGNLTEGLYSDPYEFVDRCQRAVSHDDQSAESCRVAQWIEWQALMSHCLQ